MAPVESSESVHRKKTRRVAPAWRTLLSRLATIVHNECAFGTDERTRVAIHRETAPDPWQRRAFLQLDDYFWPRQERTR